jgi:hypothetical protein
MTATTEILELVQHCAEAEPRNDPGLLDGVLVLADDAVLLTATDEAAPGGTGIGSEEVLR